MWWLWAAQMNPLLAGMSDYGSAKKPLDRATAAVSRHGLQASCVWSPVDGFSQFSDNWSQVTGQMPGDCMGHAWHDHWQGDFSKMFHEAVGDLFSAAPEDRTDSVVIEGEVMHGAGEWRSVQLAMLATGLSGEQKLTILVVDTTEQRAMQHQVALAELQSKAVEHCRSSFLSNMSHELRTPLNAMMGFAQLLESKQITDEACAEEYLRHIRMSGEELLGKISDLIELADIDAGKARLDEQALNVSEMIQSAIEMQSHKAFQKKVRIRSDVNRPNLVIRADKARLLHCLSYQLAEAVANSPDEGVVTISCHASEADGVQIAVHDCGQEMNARRLDNIRASLRRKQSYYQTDIEDISIGLAVCKEMAELHEGQFQVDSRVGRGTITALKLPSARIVSLSAKVKRKNIQFG